MASVSGAQNIKIRKRGNSLAHAEASVSGAQKQALTKKNIYTILIKNANSDIGKER